MIILYELQILAVCSLLESLIFTTLILGSDFVTMSSFTGLEIV